MLAQYTQAAMVAENRRLAAPASVDSLPTSAMQEDHVSMGWGAARKLRTSIANLARILAIELVAAARGLDLRAPLEPGAGTGAALASRAGRPASRARGPTGGSPLSWGRRGARRLRRSCPPSRVRSGSSGERPAGGARAAWEPRSPAAAGSRRRRCGC